MFYVFLLFLIVCVMCCLSVCHFLALFCGPRCLIQMNEWMNADRQYTLRRSILTWPVHKEKTVLAPTSTTRGRSRDSTASRVTRTMYSCHIRTAPTRTTSPCWTPTAAKCIVVSCLRRYSAQIRTIPMSFHLSTRSRLQATSRWELRRVRSPTTYFSSWRTHVYCCWVIVLTFGSYKLRFVFDLFLVLAFKWWQL